MTPYEHPDWPALLRAVIESPDDDTPRLVAADWLEERGEPARAELIRVQCELARGGRIRALIARERKLLGSLSFEKAQWALDACPGIVQMLFLPQPRSPLAATQIVGVEQVTFRRGFVERVDCPATEWRNHGAAVVQRSPLRNLVLLNCGELGSVSEWLPFLSTLARLRYLAVVGRSDFVPVLCDWLGGQLPAVSVDARIYAPGGGEIIS